MDEYQLSVETMNCAMSVVSNVETPTKVNCKFWTVRSTVGGGATGAAVGLWDGAVVVVVEGPVVGRKEGGGAVDGLGVVVGLLLLLTGAGVGAGEVGCRDGWVVGVAVVGVVVGDAVVGDSEGAVGTVRGDGGGLGPAEGGALVGPAEGDSDGTKLGIRLSVGADDAATLGVALGPVEGITLGVWLGETLGAMVRVGTDDALGIDDGTSLGSLLEGTADGATDGAVEDDDPRGVADGSCDMVGSPVGSKLGQVEGTSVDVGVTEGEVDGVDEGPTEDVGAGVVWGAKVAVAGSTKSTAGSVQLISKF